MDELTPKNVAASPVERFREFLATRGMRLTQERETIITEIFAAHEHFDVDEIVSRLTRPGEKRVSRATVYRPVKSLEEAGLIRKVARSNDRGRRAWFRFVLLVCVHCASMCKYVQ